MPDHQILVPLDGSVLAECVLPHVVAIGRVFDSKLILMRVIKPPNEDNQVIDPLSWEMNKAEAESYLSEKKELLSKIFNEVEYRLFEGKPAEKICEFSRDEDVDLIALSTHGQSGLSEWNISSVVQKTILHSQKSILLIRAYQSMDIGLEDIQYKKLVLPMDCSQRSELVLPLATRIGKYYDAKLLLAHINQKPQIICKKPPSEDEKKWVHKISEHNQKYAKDYFEQLSTQLERNGCKSEALVKTSTKISETLHATIAYEEVDLILLTAHGLTGSQRWPYGSLATGFIIYGGKPLIIMQDMKQGEIEASGAEIAAKEYKGH